MSETVNTNGGGLNHPAKAVYFATGSPDLAARDLVRLGLSSNGTALRVVCPRSGMATLARKAALRPNQMVAYSSVRALWAWLRILSFLGFTRDTEIICLSAPQNFRFMKMMAFSFRGRGRFSTGEGDCTELSLLDLLRLHWNQYWNCREQRIQALPLAVIGAASAKSLRMIVASLRARYPGKQITGWLQKSDAAAVAEVFDEVRIVPSGFFLRPIAEMSLLLSSRKFISWIIPYTNEDSQWMKLTALLWPLRCRQIYNEMGDTFPLSDWGSLWRHFSWRFIKTDRRFGWPVAVAGSASGFYLEKIVASVRVRFLGSELHGWLGPLQVESAGHLFDVVHRLDETGNSFSTAWRMLQAGRNYGSWIVPCTDEPFRWLKFLALALPLRSRYLYNEVGDGFPLRDFSTTWRHFFWRLRYKFTFQFLSSSSDSSLQRRLIHVPAYAFRLLLAAPILFRANQTNQASGHNRSTGALTSVDLMVIGPQDHTGAGPPPITSASTGVLVRVVELDGDTELSEQVWQRARNHDADYICILDSQCQPTAAGWLEQMLEAFDETVAQVGPQLRVGDHQTICQGALIDPDGQVCWNTNSAARFHARPEWLEVQALPWVCVVIRRTALLQTLLQVETTATSHRPANQWIHDDLCRLFSNNGWLSICNSSVTVAHPLVSRVEQVQRSSAT
ncbi:MAG: hypothetical protein EXQ56_11495 [Acidobacteria bacterium]|nr:hypothetical protein [Acidobacteriota bacterium]